MGEQTTTDSDSDAVSDDSIEFEEIDRDKILYKNPEESDLRLNYV